MLVEAQIYRIPANIEAKETFCNAKLLTRLARTTICLSLNWFWSVFKKLKLFTFLSFFCMEINRFNEQTLSAFSFCNYLCFAFHLACNYSLNFCKTNTRDDKEKPLYNAWLLIIFLNSKLILFSIKKIIMVISTWYRKLGIRTPTW